MEILKWKRDLELDYGYTTNKLLVVGDTSRDVSKVIEDYTLIDEAGVDYILQQIPNSKNIFHGQGIDLGGGVSLISSCIMKFFNPEKIFCLEIVEEVVKTCHEKVQTFILGKKPDNIISVVGDFNHVELPDDSLDFIIFWDSLHHARDPIISLQECKRVLKNDGFVIIIDKVHNNSIPDNEIERMLNIQYDESFLERSFRSKDTVLLRKDDGEHEYRFFEWENFFKISGFNIIENFLIKTETQTNKNTKNDNNLKEIFVKFNVGGFQQQKIIYVLQPINHII
jgi:ubiquinone/menaquinone biosynthesis C-methylase UbiE